MRKQTEAETIQRIIAATVALHAEKGALATTHAEIAEAAGVSVATVYKHFPSREALLPHCTGLVGKQAPQIDADLILGARSRKEKIALLVRALHGQYRYFHPWIRWVPRDASALPLLAQIAEESRQQTESLVRSVLDAVAGTPVGDDVFALAMVILDYPAWQRLDQMLNDPERVADAAGHALQLLMSRLP
ncbi:MAG TPA: helix-turn-helix domain-containing protein [Noviherbaspirillum sp.]